MTECSLCVGADTAAAHAAASGELLVFTFSLQNTPQFYQSTSKNNEPAKVFGKDDQLPNHSQVFAAFGWWRVLISTTVKTRSLISKHDAAGLHQRNALSKVILFDPAFLYQFDGRWYIFDEHIRNILSYQKVRYH